MTPTEMQRAFEIGLQKLDSGAFDDVIPGEIENYLNSAQLKFIKNRFEKARPGDPRSFQSNSRVTEELRTLLATDTVLDAYYAGDSVGFGDFKVDKVDFSNDHLYLISYRAEIIQLASDAVVIENGASPSKRVIDSGTTVNRTVRCRLFQQADLDRSLEDPFNTTRVLSPIVVVTEKGLDIYTVEDEFIADKVRLTYLKEPTDIDIGGGTASILPESTHRDIVNLAIDLAFEDLKQSRPNQPAHQPLTD